MRLSLSNFSVFSFFCLFVFLSLCLFVFLSFCQFRSSGVIWCWLRSICFDDLEALWPTDEMGLGLMGWLSWVMGLLRAPSVIIKNNQEILHWYDQQRLRDSQHSHCRLKMTVNCEHIIMFHLSLWLSFQNSHLITFKLMPLQ